MGTSASKGEDVAITDQFTFSESAPPFDRSLTNKLRL